METILLEAKQEVWVPSMQEFRDFVDQRAAQWKKRDEIYIKESYLLASRPSELLLRVTPYMTAHNMTHPYGKLLNYKMERHYKIHGEGMDTELAILLVDSAVAKRQKLKRKEDTEDPQSEAQVLKCKMKTVPIICSPEDVEPWGRDILLWLSKHEGREKHPLAFNMTEMTCQNIVKRCLGDLNPSIHPHSLRHFRSTHLQRNYHLDPYELAFITGWTLKSMLAAKGQQASSMMDTYIHVNWEDLIPKLNVPLVNVL